MKYIQLTKGRRAIVDDEVYDLVSQYKWHCKESGKTCYARRSAIIDGKKTQVYLHRFIMELIGQETEDLIVDHINGSGLNNTLSNLRICTAAQNARNRKPKGSRKLKGISKRGNLWQATLTHEGDRYSLGSYKSKIEAAQAYDNAAKKYHGEYARVNF